jgi:hypothetical protein
MAIEKYKLKRSPAAPYLRALIEVSFIIFLFYSNLLMGEYTGTNIVGDKGLWWAIANVFTLSNFIIALITALIGYFVFEFLRRKL